MFGVGRLTRDLAKSTQAVLINIDVYDRGKKTTILKNKLERVEKGQPFMEIFSSIAGKCDVDYEFDTNSIKVYISSTATRENEIYIDLNKTLF